MINLNDIRLFDITYRSQNTLTGAYLDYKIECSDCHRKYIIYTFQIQIFLKSKKLNFI